MYNYLFEIVSWMCLLIVALPVLYLLLAAIAPLIKRNRFALHQPAHRIAIIVPAHNEELLISETVRSAFALNYPKELLAVLVIADNCSDATAELARGEGARVLERTGNPGKGQGLNDAFNLLLQENWDAFLVLDADSCLHPETLMEIDRQLVNGSQAIQIRYGVLNPGESLRTRAMELSTASYNALRPLGKSALGISAGINGNGFCLTRQTIQRVPYLAHSIVEDIEYHILLLSNGLHVDFLDHVWVKAQMPVGGKGATVQRVRWERGRIMMVKTYARPLLKSLLGGNRRALDGLIDVLMPPVSLVMLGLLVPLLLGDGFQRGLALLGLLVMVLHYLVAAVRYGHIGWFFLLMAYVPWYVFWKTGVVLRSLLTEKNLPWLRTDRHTSKN